MVACEPDCVVCGWELEVGFWRMWRWRYEDRLWVCDGAFCARCWEDIFLFYLHHPDADVFCWYDPQWDNYDTFLQLLTMR